jgi:hypothetical protein
MKIGPANAITPPPITYWPRRDLRTGTVKARRPRVRAGGAERRALHGAEHRSSIEGVSGGAPDHVQIAALTRAETGATFVSARTLVSIASERAERARLRYQVFPHERGPDRPEDLRPFRAHMRT